MPAARASRARLLAGAAATLILVLTGIPVPGSNAQLVLPASGAVKVALSTLFEWTPVANVQAYYLYVGTTPGAKDVVNSGETLQTTLAPKPLPEGRTLYARIWTKNDNTWSYLDSSFSTLVLRATLVAPANGSIGVPLSTTFTWSPADDVQAYYLYVGTSAGSNDVVNSGETNQTSWSASNLPEGRTLYARMWTKVAGTWSYLDSTFTTVSIVAKITTPADGAVVAAAPVTVQWTTVPNVQAYYLYGGTTLGAKNLINTGEILQTSVTSAALPQDKTIYLRMWTKVGGVWRYVDSSITTTGTKAKLITPANGASVFPVGATFTWGPVAGVQAYYLYVGTTAGATDVVNTGEIQSTSVTATLPEERTLYARLWTKRNNFWQYSDSTLTTTAKVAMLTAPAHQAQAVPLATTFQWTPVPNAEAYYLYVGATAGANDVVNTGEIQQTSYAASNLPHAETLFARMWTRMAGVWRWTDSTFTTVSLVSHLIAPANGAVEVPLAATFSWHQVAGADKYDLYVGTAPGLNDVVNSGELSTLTYDAPLPELTVLHARLQTRAGGIWRYSDTTFTTTRTKARFVHPVDKAIGVNLATPIQWTPVPAADAYRVVVAGHADGSDVLLDSGETTGASWPAQSLPADRPLYARLMTRIAGAWRFTDAVFTAQAAPARSSIVAPANGSTAVAAGVPFEWSDVPVAAAYRLQIGTAPGGSNVHDSGEIAVRRRLVEGMPAGVTLYGRISTLLGSSWSAQNFTFKVANPGISVPQRIAFAEWASGEVRRMASGDNVPAIGSRLASAVSDLNTTTALCTDYAMTLVGFAEELDLGLTVRRLDIGFLNLYEAHTLTELLDPVSGRWVILDPTFGLSARRVSDGQMASAEDLQAATVAQGWAAIGYVWQTAAGDAYVRSYYIDYPLLFLNLFHEGQSFSEPESPAVGPYLEGTNSFVSDERKVYVLRCQGGVTSVTVTVDGEARTVGCSALNGYSAAFFANSVEGVAESGASLYRLRRFVF